VKILLTTISIGIFFCLIPSYNIYGQDYSFRQFTTKDGLVQMQVLRIFQDSRGYLWIGTKGGVSKFDGEKFENFTRADGILGASTTQILEDSKGNIWFAHSSGLSKYDGEKISTFSNGEKIKLQNAYIDDKDMLYLKYSNAVYTFKDSLFQKINYPKNARDVGYSSFHQSLLTFIDSVGICFLNNDGTYKLFQPMFFSCEYVRIIQNTSSGNLEFECRKNSLANKEVYILNIEKPKKGWERKIKIPEIIKPDFDAIPKSYFFNLDHKGLLQYFDKKNKKISAIQEFDFNRINQVFQDKQNNIWLASEEGLIQVFGQSFQHFNSPPFSFIWSMVQDKAGNIWMAGFQKELQVFDGKSIIKTYSLGRNQFYFGALRDNRQNLIFPTGSGLQKYEDKQFNKLSIATPLKNKVHLIAYEDKERDLILTGVLGGIKVFQNYKEIAYFNKKDGLHDAPYIVSIEKDNNENYWLGSYRGLSRFNYETKVVENYTRQNNKLPVDGVISICKDYKGTMWFGCYEGGLAMYDYKVDSIIHIENERLRPAVSFITTIDTTHLLIGGVDGLYVFDLQHYYNTKQVRLKHYNHRNGYLGIEPTQSAVMKDSKGYIWVASATSVDKIDPKQLDLSVRPLQTAITTVNQKKYPFNTPSVTLPKGENNVEYRFEAVGFDRPVQTQFAYKLEKEGEQSNWSNWRPDDFAVYSKLSSGNYTFQVKSRQGSSTTDRVSIATLPLVVDLDWWREPDFFKTAFVILGVFFSLLGLFIIGTIWFRSKAKQREIEVEVQKRKSRYLQVQSSLAQMNPHFIFNVLQSMQGLIIGKDWQKADEYLVQLSKLIRRFLEASISSDWTTAKENYESFTLEQEIELLTAYIKLEQQLPKNTFDYSIDYNGIDIANYDIPPMLIQPFVENAIKHGLNYKRGGEKNLTITFSLNKAEELLCIIEDTGVGRIAAKELQTMSFQAFQSQGTKLVEKRVQLLNESGYNISIETNDRIEGGTLVHLKIAGYYDY